MVAYVELALRVLLGGVFAVSALSKVASRESLRAFVKSLMVLAPELQPVAKPVAAAVVAAEASIVVLLAVPALGVPGFALSAALLTAMGALLARAVRRRVTIGCGCFGRPKASVSRRHVVRNAVLVVCSGGGLAADLLTDAQIGSAGGIVLAVLLAVGGLAVVLLLDVVAAAVTRRLQVSGPAIFGQ